MLPVAFVGDWVVVGANDGAFVAAAAVVVVVVVVVVGKTRDLDECES